MTDRLKGWRKAIEETRMTSPSMDERKAAPWQYQKNVYVCRDCGAQIVTVDRDSGTTPFLIACRESGSNCKGLAESNMYRVPQSLTPTHEWFHPTPEEYAKLDKATQRHVDDFRLILRKIAP